MWFGRYSSSKALAEFLNLIESPLKKIIFLFAVNQLKYFASLTQTEENCTVSR